MAQFQINSKRIKSVRKSLVAFVSLFFLIISCDNNDNGNNSSGQMFRQIYNNTSWVDIYGTVYTFTSNRIFNLLYNNVCYFYVSGTYSNIDYDGCVYNSVENLIVQEDNNTLSAREIVSNNGSGSSCGGEITDITFEVLNENTMEVQLSYDGVLEKTFIISKTTAVSNQGCVNGTQSGFLW